MPTFIFYKCKKCNQRLGGQDAYQSIGIPYLLCQKCNTINIISEHRTEWELKNMPDRLLFRTKVILFALLFGSGTAVAISELSKEHLNISYYISIPIGIFIWLCIINSDLQNNINSSKERMKDKKYVESLKNLGIIKNNNM